MDCYSNENLHVLLKQEVGAYATYDYLRGMTSEDRLQNNHPKEEVNHGSTSHDEDDEDPGRTGSVSRKRKRISPKMMTTHADIDLIIKARRDRQVWRQRVCLWFYAGTKEEQKEKQVMGRSRIDDDGSKSWYDSHFVFFLLNRYYLTLFFSIG